MAVDEMADSPAPVRAIDVRPGDEVLFAGGSSYRVEAVEGTTTGMVRHRFNADTASNCYAPGELLRVRRAPVGHT